MTRVSFTFARTARTAIVLVFASLLAGSQALVASAGSAPASSTGDAQVSVPRADQGTSDELGTAPGTGATHRVGIGAASGGGNGATNRRFEDGVVLVGYKGDASAKARGAARQAIRASGKPISPLARDAERLVLPPGTSVGDAVTELQ